MNIPARTRPPPTNMTMALRAGNADEINFQVRSREIVRGGDLLSWEIERRPRL